MTTGRLVIGFRGFPGFRKEYFQIRGFPSFTREYLKIRGFPGFTREYRVSHET